MMNSDKRLAAFRVERRSITVVVFDRDHLDYSQTRQLSSRLDKAEDAAVGFAAWITDAFDIGRAALERIVSSEARRRIELSAAITTLLRQRGIPIWEVSKRDLLESYSIPPPRTRTELRQIIASLWPILSEDRAKAAAVMDAAALGLYVEFERILH